MGLLYITSGSTVYCGVFSSFSECFLDTTLMVKITTITCIFRFFSFPLPHKIHWQMSVDTHYTEYTMINPLVKRIWPDILSEIQSVSSAQTICAEHKDRTSKHFLVVYYERFTKGLLCPSPVFFFGISSGIWHTPNWPSKILDIMWKQVAEVIC